MKLIQRWILACGLGLPLLHARAAEAQVDPSGKAQAFSDLVDGDVCPQPEEGVFAPRPFRAFDVTSAAWAGILARTRYPNEVRTAPDGSRIYTMSADGTTYHLWHAGRSGTTHSPEPNTLLHDFVAITEDLRAYIESPKTQRAAAETELKTRLGLLMKRVRSSEPCLRSEPWVAPRDRRGARHLD